MKRRMNALLLTAALLLMAALTGCGGEDTRTVVMDTGIFGQNGEENTSPGGLFGGGNTNPASTPAPTAETVLPSVPPEMTPDPLPTETGTLFSEPNMRFSMMLPPGWTAETDLSDPTMRLAYFSRNGTPMAGVVYATYTMEEIYADREALVSSIAGEGPGIETTFSGEQNVEINGRNGKSVAYSFSQSGQVYANLYLVFIPGTNADSYTNFFMIPVEMEYDEGLTSDVETMTTSFTITG